MSDILDRTDVFSSRHIGPSNEEIRDMLSAIGASSVDELVERTIPQDILLDRPLDVPPAQTEFELINRLRVTAKENTLFRSYIGMGYSGTVTPNAILRNIFENPSWYTQYTPYQAEIAQGRLEALLNFQTMVSDLTGLPIANASMLDEATAAAEAMMMISRAERNKEKNTFFVSARCHPQTISVVKLRAEFLDIHIEVGNSSLFEFREDVFGALLQYPTTDGNIEDYSEFCARAHDAGARVVVATDLMALAVLTPPGEFGADVAVGNSQRFGVPLGYGGPHAGFLSTTEDFKRQIPGRIIGVTVDTDGNYALRMALQTREQHIRRDKATSNICTAQVLLAIMAGSYAVYHGPRGIRRIANRIHHLTKIFALGLGHLGYQLKHKEFYDTVRVDCGNQLATNLMEIARDSGINLRAYGDGTIGVSLDETVTAADLDDLFAVFGHDKNYDFTASELADHVEQSYDGICIRMSPYLEHPVFNSYHSETELMRYLHMLAQRDLSLTTSMIPLGSCTMKLNAASELIPVSWPEFSSMHPFVPVDQAGAYKKIVDDLSAWLAEITGFDSVSLQPNSGASGEYTGLVVIRKFFEAKGEAHRNVCLIPSSAHGTNPASAVMAGMKVIVVACDDRGNINIDDLRSKAEANRDNLAALMITYPSTHGVFEAGIREICQTIHDNGGLVYLDGANMNAQVGLCRPGDFGADVCHLNLHKTFAIPHGGGGPGMGPIGVTAELAPYLPTHPVIETGGSAGTGPVAAAPFGSANILLISWAYIALLGAKGLRESSEIAVLNANYLAKRLEGHFDILYRGPGGSVAHEFIVDLRPFKQSSGITEVDVAKRLMDYGYHAPTMSWPVAGTMMIEPTESESKAELDRFAEAMISIRAEIQEVELDILDREDNPLKNAPHTAAMVTATEWDHPYARERACFPDAFTKQQKFWPSVRRVNDAYGDRNLICTCPPVEAYAE
ncbi:MAG: aminomethyl-transferring glycine dehydrogenase [Rhodothermales bacterium]|nr:aminomethyl-transferring glycine dehydrogenase [Rhodothermales bacterium]